MLRKQLVAMAMVFLIALFMCEMSFAADADTGAFNHYGVQLGSRVDEVKKILTGRGFTAVKEDNLYTGSAEGFTNAKVFLNFEDDTQTLQNVTLEFIPSTPEERKAADALFKKFMEQGKKAYGNPTEDNTLEQVWDLEGHRRIGLTLLPEKGIVDFYLLLKTWE